MTKAEIQKINNQLRQTNDFTVVNVLLDVIGKNDGMIYAVLNRRVVFLKEAHGRIEYHDAYAWADE